MKGGLKSQSLAAIFLKGILKKADHDLVVMTDMGKLGHEDWVVTAAYYAMYHAAMAVLSKIGLESKEHAATAAVLEYFFGTKIGKPLIESFNDIKERKDKLHLPKLAAYRLHTNPNYSHASSLFLSGGGFFLVKPTFSIIEPHFGHLILLFLIKFSGLQLFILLRKCFAYIFLVLLEYVP